MASTQLARVSIALFRASFEYSSSIYTCGLFATRVPSRLNDDMLNAILITNKFNKKEKLLENEKRFSKTKVVIKTS